MDEPIHTFLPDHSSDMTTFWITAVIALAALGGLTALLRRPGRGERRNYRLLFAMLLFFAFLLAAGAAVFSWMTVRKTGPVYIYADAIETPYGRADFADIRDAGIKTEKEASLINPNIVTGQTRLLIIEEKEGKTHILAEENYKISPIMDALREAIKEWRQ